MGKGRSYRQKKRKFYGNRSTSNASKSSDTNNHESTSSCRKLLTNESIQMMTDERNELVDGFKELCGNRIIDMAVLINVFSVLCCPLCFQSTLNLKEESKFGLSSNMLLCCQNCNFVKGFCTSKKSYKLVENNTRFVYALRLIGKGFSAGKKFCCMLNLPFLSKTTFRYQESKLLTVTAAVADRLMKNAASEVRALKKSDNSVTNCGVSVDGTWQRRGYSSLNGCVSVISIDTGKVLDLEMMSQFCRVCNKLKQARPTYIYKHTCSNYKGSAGNMEPVGVYRIFERSKESRKLQYTDYYGDGDCKAYDAVKNIYEDITVEKFECIGHIQKRVGTRLRKLKTTQKGLGGRGKLTDNFIDRLQNYYGIAIRSNVGNLNKMQSAVIAAFFHCSSSYKHPKHGQCPVGIDSWCRFQRAKAMNQVYKEKTAGLPQNIINIVKPVYMQLCDQKLLNKCLHGKTQNANEAFNGVLWQIIPKEVFVEMQTLRFGANIAIIQFNAGFKSLLSVLEEMGIDPGYFTLCGSNDLDMTRIMDSKRHSLTSAKVSRRKLRATRKKKNIKTEEAEGIVYKSGHF